MCGPGMEHNKSSPLMTRWSMASSSTFPMAWNPRIWSTLLAPSEPKGGRFLFAPRPGIATVQSSPRRCHAQDDPQRQVERFAICPHLHQRFTWLLWCTPGYSNSETILQIVLLTLLPSLSTQRRYYQAGERGKTHVFHVFAVSFVRRSASLWPGNCHVIHCMPGSG